MSFGFLRSPRWLLAVALAVATVVAFVNLGMWQLRRLDERRLNNAIIAAREAEPPIDLADTAAGEDLAWRRTVATGRYDAAGQVILEGRSHLEVAGSNVLTPLLLGDGRAVVVNRGWIPIAADVPPPPAGTVTVTGILRPGEGSGLLAGGSGPVERIGSIDLERLDGQIEADVVPVYLQLQSQTPEPGPELTPVPLPEPDEGPHLSYAVQWFLFAAIVLIGLPVLVVRTARTGVSRTPSRPASGP